MYGPKKRFSLLLFSLKTVKDNIKNTLKYVFVRLQFTKKGIWQFQVTLTVSCMYKTMKTVSSKFIHPNPALNKFLSGCYYLNNRHLAVPSSL